MRIEKPTTISARSGAFGADSCRRLRARSISELKQAGLIPELVKERHLVRVAEKVSQPAFYEARAESLLDDEFKRTRQPATDEFRAARLEQFGREVQVAGLAQELDRELPEAIRRTIAKRTVGLIRLGGYEFTAFQLDEDLVVRAPLTFAPEITVCRARDIRVANDAVISGTGPYFIMYARSFEGTYRSAGEAGVPGQSGRTGTDGGKGGTGRHALCRDMLHKDQVPSNGGRGGDGGNGGNASKGGDGGDGTPYEAHIDVLSGGMVVDTSGGPGGRGGDGGTGGKGGDGGTGGDGKGCEPAGLGGPGGNGGSGGSGSGGGNGGDAGDIFVYYVSDQSAGSPPVLIANGGAAGQGGQGGSAGAPGQPGNPGSESKYGKARWNPLEAAGGVVPGPGTVLSNGESGGPGLPGNPGEKVLQQVPSV